jgi:hypothetical protein
MASDLYGKDKLFFEQMVLLPVIGYWLLVIGYWLLVIGYGLSRQSVPLSLEGSVHGGDAGVR